MNLVLDFGNTRIKAAIFEKGELKQDFVFNQISEAQQTLLQFPNIHHGLVASVTAQHQVFVDLLKTRFPVMLFEASTPTPLQNLYRSVNTLGSDRLAAAVGAFGLYPNQDVLTIDAGTCIKYNFVNTQNHYLGGAISPGLPMRLKAMHEYTHALPLIEVDKNYDKLTGQSSAESLLSGALIGAACEVDSMIDRYRVVYPNLVVVLTGGDADYLSKQVKNRFFAHPKLLLQGLNTILRYNLEK